jgi:hypothetical protein
MSILGIFDWAERFSAETQRIDRLREEQEAARPSCGKCTRWMKSRECPLEQNVNGYSRGPSSNAVPCELYQIA